MPNKLKITKPSTTRQRKHCEKMKSLDLSLVQVWVPNDRVLEIRSIAARMQAEGSQDLEPSTRQLAFAQFLCDMKGLTLTQEHLKSSKKLSRWLNENRKKPDRARRLRVITTNLGVNNKKIDKFHSCSAKAP